MAMTSGQITYGYKFDTELQLLHRIVEKLQLLNDRPDKKNKFVDYEHNSYTLDMSPESWTIIEPIVKLLTETVHLSYKVLKEEPYVRIGLI